MIGDLLFFIAPASLALVGVGLSVFLMVFRFSWRQAPFATVSLSSVVGGLEGLKQMRFDGYMPSLYPYLLILLGLMLLGAQASLARERRAA